MWSTVLIELQLLFVSVLNEIFYFLSFSQSNFVYSCFTEAKMVLQLNRGCSAVANISKRLYHGRALIGKREVVGYGACLYPNLFTRCHLHSNRNFCFRFRNHFEYSTNYLLEKNFTKQKPFNVE